jgi:hypothetical protein
LTKDIALGVVAWTKLADQKAVAHLECPRCKMPSAAEISIASGKPSSVPGFGHLIQHGGDPTLHGWTIDYFWPDIPKPNLPEFLPPEVERIYLQAERNFAVAGNEDAAGTMYRKALDIGLKAISPSLTGMLGPKIKKLTENGVLTNDIAAWSDQVRELGNEAAHDAPQPTREDITDLRNFAEMVLRYLFTLPNMVRKRRGEPLLWGALTGD